MARISSEEAVKAIGNRFDLVLVASQRARELKRGSAQKVEGIDASTTITALREIEQGLYTKHDYLKTLPNKKKGHRDEYFT
jgi:DNA-directed RNA polymerase subunit omega